MMFSSWFFRPGPETVKRYRENHDLNGLIRLLAAGDRATSQAAEDAIAGFGPEVTELLAARLHGTDNRVRLGIIGALAKIKDPRSVEPLIPLLKDHVNEVRWQAAIALGEIGDRRSVSPLVGALGDPDKYVRYGSAMALTKTGWIPHDSGEKAWFSVAVQEWPAVKNLGRDAIPVLSELFADRDPVIRQKILRTLGEIGHPDAEPVILRALSDPDREVRWEAVIASGKCHVPILDLPRGIAKRPMTRKNPLIAGFMNFMLPGLGYGYLGKWWGIMIFQIDITITVWLFKTTGEVNTYSVLFPFYVLLALHAWYIARMIPDEPP